MIFLGYKMANFTFTSFCFNKIVMKSKKIIAKTIYFLLWNCEFFKDWEFMLKNSNCSGVSMTSFCHKKTNLTKSRFSFFKKQFNFLYIFLKYFSYLCCRIVTFLWNSAFLSQKLQTCAKSWLFFLHKLTNCSPHCISFYLKKTTYKK